MAKTRGFTLIELMIVVLIIGLMLLVAAPFTRAWTDSAKLTEAKGILTQAIGVAKASALRNPAGLQMTSAAAVVCINSDNKIEVLQSSTATTASCPSTGTLIWQADLPVEVAVVGELVSGTKTNIDCLSLNNRAFNLSVGGSCVLTSELSIKIPKTGTVRDALETTFY